MLRLSHNMPDRKVTIWAAAAIALQTCHGCGGTGRHKQSIATEVLVPAPEAWVSGHLQHGRVAAVDTRVVRLAAHLRKRRGR
eukprot:COSAG06_NODE_2548_length_6692_cov_35.291066_6_plen_82_part_00